MISNDDLYGNIIENLKTLRTNDLSNQQEIKNELNKLQTINYNLAMKFDEMSNILKGQL